MEEFIEIIENKINENEEIKIKNISDIENIDNISDEIVKKIEKNKKH